MSFFCLVSEFLLIVVSDFAASLSDAVFLSQELVGTFLQSVADDALLVAASATVAVIFLHLSVKCEVDLSPLSSSLDFCPSGDFARPRRYLHTVI